MTRFGVNADSVALVAATAKTVLEVVAGSNRPVTVVQWWVEFHGVDPAALPVLVELLNATASIGSATSVTPRNLDMRDGTTIVATAQMGDADSTEGTPGNVRELHRVPPTSGLVMQYPLGRELVFSDRFRIRCNAPANVTVTAGAHIEE